jgi:hypothetical protein
VSQTQRLRLTHVHDGHARRTNRLHFRQQLTLNALLKQRFEFVRGVEVVFYRILGRVRNQDDFFDPCSNNLVDNVLNHWLVDDRQHLFRNGFCGWQHMHARPATGMTAFKLIIISSTLKWLTNYSS